MGQNDGHSHLAAYLLSHVCLSSTQLFPLLPTFCSCLEHVAPSCKRRVGVAHQVDLCANTGLLYHHQSLYPQKRTGKNTFFLAESSLCPSSYLRLFLRSIWFTYQHLGKFPEETEINQGTQVLLFPSHTPGRLCGVACACCIDFGGGSHRKHACNTTYAKTSTEALCVRAKRMWPLREAKMKVESRYVIK